jgi:type IV secretion system protein VirD4
MDRKYNILKHPNVKLSTDGDGTPYIHGGAPAATAAIEITPIQEENL